MSQISHFNLCTSIVTKDQQHSEQLVSGVLKRFSALQDFTFAPHKSCTEWHVMLPQLAPNLRSLSIQLNDTYSLAPMYVQSIVTACAAYKTQLQKLSFSWQFLDQDSLIVSQLHALTSLTSFELVGYSYGNSTRNMDNIKNWIPYFKLKHLRLDNMTLVANVSLLDHLSSELVSFETNNTNFNATTLACVKHFSKLQKLSFGACSLGADWNSVINSFPSLKELKIEGCGGVTALTHSTITHLALRNIYVGSTLPIDCPNLLSMDFSNNAGDHGVKFVTTPKNLRRFTMSRCPDIKDAFIAYLNELKAFESTTQLQMFECRSLVAPAIKQCQQLKQLYVICPGYKSKEVNILLNTCPQLNSITLCGIKDSLPEIAAKNTSLHQLILSACPNLSDEAIYQWLLACPNISHFALRFNDQFAKCSIPSNTIKQVELIDCIAVTNEFVTHLFVACSGMRHCKISGCKQLTNVEASNKSLYSLEFSMNPISKLLLACPNVNELRLESLQIQALEKGSHLDKVDTLSLAGLKLGNTEFASLCALMPHTRHLSVKYCELLQSIILDSCMNQLETIEVERCKELQQVALGKHVTMASMSFLRKLDYKNIKHHGAKLKLNQVSNIEEHVVKAKKHKNKNCTLS